MPTSVTGVTVVGDFLRSDALGRPGATDRPAQWLCDAVKRQIAVATGLPVTTLLPTDNQRLAAWIGELRAPEDADRFWAARHARLPSCPGLYEAVLQPLQRRFCLTYEAPPYLRHLLDAAGLPWLDVRVHPIRFLDDLLFAVRSSRVETQAALLDRSVPESVVQATAGLCEAMGRRLSDATVPPGTLLVLGQRPYDATQIVDGGFCDAATWRDEIWRLCASHPAVLLKPHPSAELHSLLREAQDSGANVLGSINDNVYRVLALSEVISVLTVNSSTAYEAPYFGKRVYTLAPLPIRVAWHGAAPDDAYASLDHALLMPDFWRLVLKPHVAAVTQPDGARLPDKPNRLRIALDSFWNYQEIDTDRIPRGRQTV